MLKALENSGTDVGLSAPRSVQPHPRYCKGHKALVLLDEVGYKRLNATPERPIYLYIVHKPDGDIVILIRLIYTKG